MPARFAVALQRAFATSAVSDRPDRTEVVRDLRGSTSVTVNYRFLEEALVEYEDAIEYYERAQAGLSETLIRDVEEVLALTLRPATSCAAVQRGDRLRAGGRRAGRGRGVSFQTTAWLLARSSRSLPRDRGREIRRLQRQADATIKKSLSLASRARADSSFTRHDSAERGTARVRVIAARNASLPATPATIMCVTARRRR